MTDRWTLPLTEPAGSVSLVLGLARDEALHHLLGGQLADDHGVDRLHEGRIDPVTLGQRQVERSMGRKNSRLVSAASYVVAGFG